MRFARSENHSRKLDCRNERRSPRHVGHADFHDGHILSMIRAGDTLTIKLEGSSGQRYAACFKGVTSFESESPEGMTVYALHEVGAESDLLRRFEFVNW